MATHWLILAPHLDDAVYSCGGLIWHWIQSGDTVSVWTICAGLPTGQTVTPFAESLHDRWGTIEAAIEVRRAEDIAALSLLGADWRHLDLPDCIYRADPHSGSPLYDSEAAIFGPINPVEQRRIQDLSAELAQTLPENIQLLIPMGLGGHVDHRLTRSVVAELVTARAYSGPIYEYIDFPYAADLFEAHPKRSAQAIFHPQAAQNAKWRVFPLEQKAVLAWIAAVAAYESQISTFWNTQAELEQAILEHTHRLGGLALFENISIP
jgi:LmbE family N-acetylglucosaminyl deacetylase